ncbi:MAG TPA: aminoglycoside phosphotransferase family protein [Iamia sp.]|nr:aminoglycoside phosphotransferase family protein [Iamia sp.]
MAAVETATALGLAVDHVEVLNDSNRLVARLTPADVVARVTPAAHHAGHHASAEREVELVRRLAATGSPVAPLDPRVPPRAVDHDGFAVTLWAHVASVDRDLPPAEYAGALAALHAGLRRVDGDAPHVADRIAAVAGDLADRDLTPDLAEADRALLAAVLDGGRRSLTDGSRPEQLLHGEPHPWNVITTAGGPLLIDFENTARGPVEYDLGWCRPRWRRGTRMPTPTWSTPAGPSSWPWSPSTAGAPTTPTRAAGRRAWPSSPPSVPARPGPPST